MADLRIHELPGLRYGFIGFFTAGRSSSRTCRCAACGLNLSEILLPVRLRVVSTRRNLCLDAAGMKKR